MATSYNLAPVPRWLFTDLSGDPLNGGYMRTLRELDPSENKAVYMDIAGAFPHTNPVVFGANGMAGPFYWEFDTDDPDETYRLEIYDVDDNLQFTIRNYTPPNVTAGSTIAPTYGLVNYIVNGVFWRNIGTSVSPTTSSLTLAPGVHAGITSSVDLSVSKSSAQDIFYIKNNTNATDTITFTEFALGSTSLTADVTPQYYLNYACTNTPAGETQKAIQFPICAKVQNLQNVAMTISLWARGNSGTQTLILQWYQFYGDGAGASTPVITPIQTLNLTASWARYTVSTTVPSVGGKILGGCGNDALFLQIQLPLGAACNLDFAKPALFLGTITPAIWFDTFDQVDSVVNNPRTGDIRVSVNNFNPYGWVSMDDGSIGSASSAATTRANIDTFPLFKLFWDNVTDANAPVSGGRGATAIADFTANKRLTLTQTAGNALARIDGANVLGSAGNIVSGAGFGIVFYNVLVKL